ncbi:hypothetical protein HYPSUDRAFT_784391 [Hypholoma sublateritium FD-334 SS-4]|uniref:Uncharacterized protein n=1 Tax=Hypholoma sublateritium (strain FD-334 SS-4) TaxID=945553 RepID=A0A0D2NNX9_HYPSF|nr:hypothetical protein HYPSUDRAFT_784391 [Hypholoma sublateritium FD-334 SS-4]
MTTIIEASGQAQAFLTALIGIIQPVSQGHLSSGSADFKSPARGHCVFSKTQKHAEILGACALSQTPYLTKRFPGQRERSFSRL